MPVQGILLPGSSAGKMRSDEVEKVLSKELYKTCLGSGSKTIRTRKSCRKKNIQRSLQISLPEWGSDMERFRCMIKRRTEKEDRK